MSKGKGRPATSDHLLSGKRPYRVHHQIVLDNEYAEALAEAKKAMETARLKLTARPDDGARVTELEGCTEEYDRIREEAEPYVVYATLKGKSPAAFDRLKREYKPTEEERRRAREAGLKEDQVAAMEYSPWRFPPILVAACCEEPKLTEDQTLSIWGMRRLTPGGPIETIPEEELDANHPSRNWNSGECEGLFLAAMSACNRRSVVGDGELGKAPSPTPASEPSKS